MYLEVVVSMSPYDPASGDDLQCVDDTWDVTKNRQEDVDEEVCIATSLEEDT